MNINLINYKLLWGKNTVYISKEKNQEFLGNCGRLIFEGGFWNGKIHGKGKDLMVI